MTSRSVRHLLVELTGTKRELGGLGDQRVRITWKDGASRACFYTLIASGCRAFILIVRTTMQSLQPAPAGSGRVTSSRAHPLQTSLFGRSSCHV